MAISVSIPKEITEYEEKIMFGLSLRKLVCLSSAILLGIGSYFLLTKLFGLSMDMASYIIVLEALPFMAFGFVKKDGMPFEQYASLLLRHKMGQHKLAYESELVIDSLPDIKETSEKEGESKYAWIFKREDNKGQDRDWRRTSWKERRAEARIKEAIVLERSKKARARKRKEARRSIKAARQEFRAAKRRAAAET